jgi:hypothetical protein
VPWTVSERAPRLRGQRHQVTFKTGYSSLVDFYDLCLLRFSRDKRLANKHGWRLKVRTAANTNAIIQPQILTVSTNAWVPPIQRREINAENILNFRTAVTALDGIVEGAVVRSATAERCCGRRDCRSARSRRRRTGNAVGVAQPEVVTFRPDGRVPGVQLVESDTGLAIDAGAGVAILDSVILLAAFGDARLCWAS